MQPQRDVLIPRLRRTQLSGYKNRRVCSFGLTTSGLGCRADIHG